MNQLLSLDSISTKELESICQQLRTEWRDPQQAANFLNQNQSAWWEFTRCFFSARAWAETGPVSAVLSCWNNLLYHQTHGSLHPWLKNDEIQNQWLMIRWKLLGILCDFVEAAAVSDGDLVSLGLRQVFFITVDWKDYQETFVQSKQCEERSCVDILSTLKKVLDHHVFGEKNGNQKDAIFMESHRILFNMMRAHLGDPTLLSGAAVSGIHPFDSGKQNEFQTSIYSFLEESMVYIQAHIDMDYFGDLVKAETNSTHEIMEHLKSHGARLGAFWPSLYSFLSCFMYLSGNDSENAYQNLLKRVNTDVSTPSSFFMFLGHLFVLYLSDACPFLPIDDHEQLAPLFIVLIHACSESVSLRKVLKRLILPCPSADLETKEKPILLSQEKQKTNGFQFIMLNTLVSSHHGLVFKSLLGELLWILCDEDVHRLIHYVGYGPSAGILQRKNCLNVPLPGKQSRDDEGNPLNYHEQHSSTVASNEMTLEEKEREAEVLCKLLMRLENQNIVKVMRQSD